MERTLDVIDLEIREVKGRTFKHLGDLLIEIVDRKLYQDRGFTNVEDYFQSEPNLPSARQAFRLISATRFSRQLPPNVPQPKSERQVRPLLGRNRDEAKLIWAIATLVAAERGCALDGKLVISVTKDFDDGALEHYVSEACALLGNSVNLTRHKRQTPQRSKKRDAESKPCEHDCTNSPPLDDVLTLTATISDLVASMQGVARGETFSMVGISVLHQTLNERHPQALHAKRSRFSTDVQEKATHLEAMLKQILLNLIDVSHCFQYPTPSACQARVDRRPLPTSVENESSEDELTVAEALLNLSNGLNDV